MIPREWKPGTKWFGLYWPPRAWWTTGPWYYNHPLSHMLGGLALGLAMHLADFSTAQTAVLAAALGFGREETQVEYWSERGGYPLYSFLGDAAFVVIGALLVVFL